VSRVSVPTAVFLMWWPGKSDVLRQLKLISMSSRDDVAPRVARPINAEETSHLPGVDLRQHPSTVGYRDDPLRCRLRGDLTITLFPFKPCQPTLRFHQVPCLLPPRSRLSCKGCSVVPLEEGVLFISRVSFDSINEQESGLR
jgi:hypothetical protein